MDYRCYTCLAKAFTKLLEEHNIPKEKREEQTKEFFSFLANSPKGLIAPEIARINQYKIKEILGVNDPYKEIKKESNKYLLDKYKHLKEIIDSSNNKFETALRLAIGGNIIDYAANPEFDIDTTIEKVLKENFSIDHSKELEKEISKSRSILYLADNAGEIVMDKLFLEFLNHSNITYAVRNAPIINDVTLEDAEYVGISKYAKVISNGYDAPSTILNKTSSEFKKIYDKADLIISKGQGNFEGLMNEKDDRLFFLMMVKCDMIAERLNTHKGGFVVSRY